VGEGKMKFQGSRKILASLIFITPMFAYASGSASVDVTLSPAGSFKGECDKVTGTAYKTADGVAAENVSVDLRTLTTGVSLRDKHTKEHLMVEKYPEAKLIKAIGKNGKGEALVEIKGVKKKVTGTYTVAGDMLKATFPIHLPDLDIKGIRYMGIGVKEDVTINVNLPIGPAPAKK
jgi:hypothetical protein